MIIGSSRADTARRRGRLAIAISLLVHAIAAFLYVHGDPLRAVLHPRAQATPREIVTIVERLTVRRKRMRLPAPPQRRPQRHPVPLVPHRVAVRVAASIPVFKAPAVPQPRAQPLPVRERVHVRPRELAKILPQHEPPEEPPGTPATVPQQLSGAQLARIENGFRSVIAREGDGHDPLAVPPAPIDAPKRYGLDVASFTQGGRDHHGLCDPVKDWTEDGFDYYYVACNVRFSDGTYERQSVPWPVRFPPGDDPFAGTSRGEKPLAMPLPGWHLSEGEPVTVELRAYAKDHGVDL